MPILPATPCTLCGAPAVERGRCARHRRPNANARGYDAKHKALRAQWAPKVATGMVRCGRPSCGQLIEPNEPWDLGHDDHDRSRYHGPEHRDCNRAAAKRKMRAANRTHVHSVRTNVQ